MQAAVFAILLMSVSAEAMEFGDRPGMVAGLSSPTLSHTMPDSDRLRRQIDALAQFEISGSKLADRPRPISNVIHVRVSSLTKDGPGRLSPEFSAVSATSPVRLVSKLPGNIRRKPTAKFGVMRFRDRPGSMSNYFKDIAIASVAPLQHVTVLALRGR